MRNYEVFSTTADTGIRFRGRDFRELYGNALRGLNLLLFGAAPCTQSSTKPVLFSFDGDGPENVLVNFLSEILSLVYRERKRVTAIEFERADCVSLRAKLRLAPCGAGPGIEIKGVTYHGLRVVERNGIMSAAVVFDI